ncbi:orotidine-5'-phosphate decarboxylase [Candidatus Woesearchaeota archaeon]|nr:orotidine-5'-phosphate decarboxylase [Candidatus Woesearchaeota archaeon]
MEPKDKIILALDVDSAEKAKALVAELHDYVGVYKINSLFNEEGPSIVKEIQDNGGKVFLDLKYHDIPNTVANYAKAATKMGVFMFNVHAGGGFEMMKAAADAVKESGAEKKPIVLAVTVLTSIDQKALNEELKVSGSVEEQVNHLAKLAKKAGMDGVVCSPKEIPIIREACGKDFVIVTPGIRPAWSEKGDQKRITTPKDAVDAGSDYLVIGRPISGAENRAEAAKKILEEISS